MNIEVVEFYETLREDHKQILKGTLHVYLIDCQIDLRGIHVSKQKGFWFFRIPHQWTLNEVGEKLFYPVMSFIDKESNLMLMNLIREKGKEYIEQNYLFKQIKMAS